MANQRVRRLFAARKTTQIDSIFSEYNLVANDQPVSLAPIKRVAIFTEAFLPKVDGVSKTSYLTIRYLQETGREVLVFAPDTSVPSVGPTEVVPLKSISMPLAEETRIALPNPIVAQRLGSFKPDLIHLASPAVLGVNGMALGRAMNVPVVGNYQTDLPGYAIRYGAPLLASPVRAWLRYIHNGCHVSLVPTNKIRDELESWGFRRLRVWGRGVDIQRFNPARRNRAMRERLLNGRDPDSLLCIYVGRLANEKCVHLLREIADLEGVALTIIGDGARREELETLFAGTQTHFTGYMVGDELGEAFASADAFFFTGPNETFGQVVQEAMAAGLPTVVTNLGGVSSLVEDGETGLICQHDASDFARAALQLRDNRELLQRLSAQARAYAELRPWSAVMSQLEDHYREAVKLNSRFKKRFGWTLYHQPLTIPMRLNWWRRPTMIKHSNLRNNV